MYQYEDEKPKILTDDGQRMFLKIRDNANRRLEEAGAVRMGNAISGIGGGDGWSMMACMDRMVELGEIVEIGAEAYSAGQNRVFVKNG